VFVLAEEGFGLMHHLLVEVMSGLIAVPVLAVVTLPFVIATATVARFIRRILTPSVTSGAHALHVVEAPARARERRRPV
jgi:hypothetical protein